MKLTLIYDFKSGASSTKEVEISESASVLELRQKVAESFETQTSQVVLIFAGKIIKDEQSLSENKVSDGKAVHVVIKKGGATAKKNNENGNDNSSASTAAASTSAAAATTSTNNTPTTPADNVPTNTASNVTNPLGSLGAGMSGLGGMSGGEARRQEMQNQMMQNPEMLSLAMDMIRRKYQDNPIVQSLMSDPAAINEMINLNRQMRQIMEQNPEVDAVIRDPENFSRAMERNPAARQEILRWHDQALRTVYKDQLDQLANMGFADRAKSMRALQECDGNVQMAVNWLLEN